MSKGLASFISALALCLGGGTLIALFVKWPVQTGITIGGIIAFAVIWNVIYESMDK